ncbi:MAG TPA: hypothetical protein VHZ97_29920 [Pseudonocardiaceae bacterium]|nr:hypothetical protein [Pseudonocardiaceae bacterium]
MVLSAPVRPVVDRTAGQRHPGDGRMPAAIAISAGFGAGLLLAAGFALFGPSQGTGIAVLAAATILLSWLATVPGALGIGVMGWLFYSGFVAHSHGQLAVTGVRDGIVAAVLIGLALVVSVFRAVLTYRHRPFPDVHVPYQRESEHVESHA